MQKPVAYNMLIDNFVKRVVANEAVHKLKLGYIWKWIWVLIFYFFKIDFTIKYIYLPLFIIYF